MSHTCRVASCSAHASAACSSASPGSQPVGSKPHGFDPGGPFLPAPPLVQSAARAVGDCATWMTPRRDTCGWGDDNVTPARRVEE
eukprot:1192352-Pyramimonas_sp.AAC.1